MKVIKLALITLLAYAPALRADLQADYTLLQNTIQQIKVLKKSIKSLEAVIATLEKKRSSTSSRWKSAGFAVGKAQLQVKQEQAAAMAATTSRTPGQRAAAEALAIRRAGSLSAPAKARSTQLARQQYWGRRGNTTSSASGSSRGFGRTSSVSFGS